MRVKIINFFFKKERKIAHRIDNKTLSNLKGPVWHLDYLNAYIQKCKITEFQLLKLLSA